MLDRNRHNNMQFPVIAALVAVAAGAGVPFYLGALGESLSSLFVLPLVLILGALFAFGRNVLLLVLILLLRASSDVFLEALRYSPGAGAIGFGGVINAAVIMLACMLVFEKPRTVSRKMAMTWAPFFAIALFGIAISPATSEAIRLYLTWLSNFAIFISAFYVVREVKDFRFCCRVVMWSSVIPAIYALYDIATNWGGVEFRLQSTFTHANILAFYLMLVISVGFYLLKRKTESSSLLKTAGLTLYLFYLLVLLLLTQTRSAWIACVVVFAVYGLLFERRYLLYLLLISVVAISIPAVQERIVDLSVGNEVSHQAKLNSFAWRVELWKSALTWMQPSHYLTGYGIGAFRELAVEFFEFNNGMNWDSHNVYVQLFFDAGLIGVLAFLWNIGRLISLLRPMVRIDSVAAFVVISQMISYLLVSTSDNMLFYLVFNWYFWFIVGAACSLVHVREVQADAGKSSEGMESGTGLPVQL